MSYLPTSITSVIAACAVANGYGPGVVDAAIEAYARRERLAHPSGRFDNARRFHISEKCNRCSGIRSPSRRFPYSEMTHGRSLGHVAGLYGVPSLHVRRALREIETALAVGAPASAHASLALMAALGKHLKPLNRRPKRAD